MQTTRVTTRAGCGVSPRRTWVCLGSRSSRSAYWCGEASSLSRSPSVPMSRRSRWRSRWCSSLTWLPSAHRVHGDRPDRAPPVGGDWADHQRRKMRGLGQSSGQRMVADLNVVLEHADRPGEPFELHVADRAGQMGTLRVDGARLGYLAVHRDGSNEILAYVERQIGQLLNVAVTTRTSTSSPGRRSTTRTPSAITGWSSSLATSNANSARATCGRRCA